MAVTDQMYLLQQLQKSVDTLPTALEVAVFRVSNGRIIQIRGLGNDRADLHHALRECLPVLTRPVDDHFDSAVNQLLTVAAYLQQTPGRKNILWFAGAFPLVSLSDAEATATITPDVSARLHIIHQLQEALAEARVSVYPVDVRGVIPLSQPSPTGQATATQGYTGSPNPAAVSGITSTPSVLGPPATGVVGQRDQMRSLAEATGGKAFTLNHLAPEISEAFSLGLRAYALSYSPSPYSNDESWHRVRISVDPPANADPRPYTLAYRPGYLATWTGIAGGRIGIRLDANSTRVATGGAHSALAATPLPFEVHIEPGSPGTGHKATLPLTLRFTVPVHDLDFRHTGAVWHDQLVVASYVYNADGRIRGGRMQQIDTALTDQQWPSAQTGNIPVTQAIDVPHDANYLMLELRDSSDKRAGTLMLSMRAVRSLAGPDTRQRHTPPRRSGAANNSSRAAESPLDSAQYRTICQTADPHLHTTRSIPLPSGRNPGPARLTARRVGREQASGVPSSTSFPR